MSTSNTKAASEALPELRRSPIWSAQLRRESLILEFGSKVDETGVLRQAEALAWLWVFLCDWRLENDEATVASCGDAEESLRPSLGLLLGACIVDVEIDTQALSTVFSFSNGILLRTFTSHSVEYECDQWYLRLADGRCLTAGPGHDVIWEQSDESSDKVSLRDDDTDPLESVCRLLKQKPAWASSVDQKNNFVVSFGGLRLDGNGNQTDQADFEICVLKSAWRIEENRQVVVASGDRYENLPLANTRSSIVNEKFLQSITIDKKSLSAEFVFSDGVVLRTFSLNTHDWIHWAVRTPEPLWDSDESFEKDAVLVAGPGTRLQWITQTQFEIEIEASWKSFQTD